MSPYKVAVIGAHGKVGKLIISKLSQRKSEFSPIAILRSQEQTQEPTYKNVETRILDVTGSVSKLSEGLKGQDAVIFSAGAGGKGLDKTFAIDLDGAVKVTEACALANIERFVIVSAIGADNREFWYERVPQLRSYYIAKKYADSEIRRTNLKYTILQPGNLVDDGETGKLARNVSDKELDSLPSNKIYRADVAEVAIQVLKDPRTIRKTLTLVNGDLPIKEYLDSF
ncbi:Piso0_001286 [Millerozyma farinosa CBS 7064]|uniref:Piso0_001286 protein n=1 Tax=Pichia sorbitophila (strain ATCC MYA-4447 / BCRC 22081 / CBS 7064 / NBRC 10061 / NRRL Y-12695) TaxID=559304 RepID=G8YMR7_PICSO|nr:Piso0_001286 [Millerozyma farinosa CBS 7064]